MIYVRSGTEALAERQIVISPGTGIQHWGTTFLDHAPQLLSRRDHKQQCRRCGHMNR